nr:uncharacterized protein LOC123757640 [Procambarus clarkii]
MGATFAEILKCPDAMSIVKEAVMKAVTSQEAATCTSQLMGRIRAVIVVGIRNKMDSQGKNGGLRTKLQCHHAHHEPRQGEPPLPHEEPEPSDAGNAPEARSTGNNTRRELQDTVTGAAGTCTSATTVECDANGTTPLLPEDPESSKSPTSAQAEEQPGILGSGRTSSVRKPNQRHGHHKPGKPTLLRRTAASSTPWGPGRAPVGGPVSTQHPAQPRHMARAQGHVLQVEKTKMTYRDYRKTHGTIRDTNGSRLTSEAPQPLEEGPPQQETRWVPQGGRGPNSNRKATSPPTESSSTESGGKSS